MLKMAPKTLPMTAPVEAVEVAACIAWLLLGEGGAGESDSDGADGGGGADGGSGGGGSGGDLPGKSDA